MALKNTENRSNSRGIGGALGKAFMALAILVCLVGVGDDSPYVAILA